MEYGDLIYIPQDVRLFDIDNNYVGKTEKPITAVLLGEDTDTTYRVYALGREASVATRHVYPMGEPGAY